MKRIKFSIDTMDCDIIGIYAKKTDDWQKLVPSEIHHCLRNLYDGTNGDISNMQGLYCGTWPIYALIVFDCADFHSTLCHESGHIWRNIIWDIGDGIVKKGDEGYGKLETLIFDRYEEEMKKQYGMVVTVRWEPNEAQKKREIT